MTETHDDVRQQLEALPSVPLPHALWKQLDARRRLQQRRRTLGTGIAGAALIALLATLPALRMPGPDPLRAGHAVAHQPPSQPAAAASAQDVQAQIRALDHALQTAYARSASDAEIAPMWVTRNALIATTQPGISTPRQKKI